jgi:hypothetical protein
MPVNILSGDAKKSETDLKNGDRMMKEAMDREERLDTIVTNEDNTNTGRNQGSIVNLE